MTKKYLYIPAQQISKSQLAQLSAARGEALYNHGQRPYFKSSTGEFTDDDGLDYISQHILLFDDQQVIGGFRLTPFASSNVPTNVITDAIGISEAKLIEQRLESPHIYESTRLFLHQDHRNAYNLIHLFAALWYVGKKFTPAEHVISCLKLSSRHAQFLSAVGGGEKLDFLKAKYQTTSKYQDDIEILYFNAKTIPPALERHIQFLKDKIECR